MKKLLVLGGTSSSVGVIKEAHELGGIYVIVADEQPKEIGIAKQIADEVVQVSTTDVEGLLKIIHDKHIDGVFSGPTEFNIVNTMNLCKAANLPFYCTREQWEACSNKETFKSMCRTYGVPCVPEYYLTDELKTDDLKKMVFPVIVKPVDGCSSKGVTVCRNEEEVRKAYQVALKYSASKRVIAEKYLIGEYGVVFRYLAINGEIYLVAINDNYTVDTSEGKIMITAAAVFPSKRTKEFIDKIHPSIVKMFKEIGIKNGTFFLQARVDGQDNQIYFHEMGLRLSGGLLYPIYKRACGFSDMKMMIRYALGETMASAEEIAKIDPYFHGNVIGSLCIPLKQGTIGKIDGINDVREDGDVFDILQYYYEGDKITFDQIGTLMQHFCRIKFMTDDYKALIKKYDLYQQMINIRDTNGKDMVYRYFKTKRLL